MDENEFEIGGVKLAALAMSSVEMKAGCSECYFAHGKDECSAVDCVPPCTAGTRKDGVFVIFVEKQQ